MQPEHGEHGEHGGMKERGGKLRELLRELTSDSERVGNEEKKKPRRKKEKGEKERHRERERERERERGRIWKKTELLRAPRTKHCRPRNTAPPPPRLLSILKCYVPGIASCGSHPLHPPPPNLYGSPFSSMHVKFALSDQRLRLPSSPRVLTDEGKRPSFV